MKVLPSTLSRKQGLRFPPFFWSPGGRVVFFVHMLFYGIV
jgi:hypothetical protein